MSNEREARHEGYAKWIRDNLDSGYRPGLRAAWFAALEWQAARQSAGATGPFPMVLHCPKCRLQHVDVGDWSTRPHKTHQCQWCWYEWRPFEYATVGVEVAPIGDNGASGYVQYSDELTPRTLGEKAAFLEGIEEGRMRAVRDAQPAESTRVELTDEEIDAVWDSVSWKDLNVSSLEHVSILRRRFARALLARASAKGA